jgi:hypothetical protein
LILALAAGMLSPGLAATPTPTRTPTRTPTFDPRTRTPTATRTPLVTSLRRQLAFGLGGGGGFAWAFECEAALKAYTGPLPAVLAGQRTMNSFEIGAICLAGLRVDKSLTITLRNGADRKILSQATYVPGEGSLDDVRRNGFFLEQTTPHRASQAGQFVELKGMPVIALYVWLPPDATPGPWQVEARSAGARLTGSLSFSWPSDRPALYVPAGKYDPLVLPGEMYTALQGHETGLYRRKAGETLKLAGFNLPPNRKLTLAFYLLSYQRGGVLYKSLPVQSDAQGRLSTSLAIAKNETPAMFHVALVLHPAAEHARDSGPFVGLVAETCPDALLSSLLVGDTVQLTIGTDLKANNLRSQPGLKGSKVGELDLTQTAVVLEGPRCADQIVWWRVRTSAGLEGWTAEGQGESRFLSPLR